MVVTVASLLLVSGCGGGSGGSGGDGAFGPGAGSTPNGAPTTSLQTELLSSAEATSLTGPLLYQTGNTVVGGTEDIVGFGFATPPFPINTNTSTNTISDDFGGAITPEVVYDELGRGVQIRILVDSLEAPIINVAYNDDNTIASTSQTTLDGDVRIQTDFIYENGRLIGKQEVSQTVTEAFAYNYSEEGVLTSGSRSSVGSSGQTTELTSFEFTVDELGRVTGVVESIASDDVLIRDATITYDASGNITAVEDFQDFFGVATQTNSTFDYAVSTEPTVNLVGFFAALNNLFIPAFVPTFAGTGS